ncbi:MAG: hypothetical protein AAF805_13995, partial [Planctomycetota bacterium]
AAALAAGDAAAQRVVQASATGPAAAAAQTVPYQAGPSQAGQYQSAQPQTALAALGQTNLLARQRAAMASAGAAVPPPTTPIRPRPVNATPVGAAGPAVRPFAVSETATGSPISPYMNLFRSDEIDGVPNYFAFVRPQLQQQRAAAQQAEELAWLQRQLQRGNPGASYGGRTTTGGYGAARYGDTAHYYRGWQR